MNVMKDDMCQMQEKTFARVFLLFWTAKHADEKMNPIGFFVSEVKVIRVNMKITM